MGSLPLHPAIVHVPMGLAIIIPFVALGIAVALIKGAVTRRTWIVVVALQAVLLGGALAAIRTGGIEVDKVVRVVGEAPIEQHEAAAEVFAWGAAAVLAVSVAVLVVPFKAATATALATSLLMFGVMGLGIRTGHAGGRLVYVHGAAAAYRPSVPGSASETGTARPAVAREAAPPARSGDNDDQTASN